MPNTNDYTICALIKYNGENTGTILGDDTSFIGHWNNTKGFVKINNTNITNITTTEVIKDWLIILYNNSLESPNNVLMYPEIESSITTEQKIFSYLYINKQKNSDWALADIVVFDKRLESIQNQELINIFKDYLLNGNLNLLNDIKAKDISTSFVNSKKSYKQIYNSELPVFNSINNDLVFRLDALNVDNSNNMTLNNDDSITNWYDLSENGVIGTSTSKAPKFKLSSENIPSILFNDSRVNFGLVDNEITDYTYFSFWFQMRVIKMEILVVSILFI